MVFKKLGSNLLSVQAKSISAVAFKSKSPVSETRGLASLKKDTVEISDSAKRWSNPTADYVPEIPKGAKNLEIPFHHEINGENISIRSVLEGIKSNSLTNRDKRYLPIEIELMYHIDKAFEKLPPLEKDCIVYRGRTENPIIKRFNGDFDIIDNAKAGDIIIPNAAYSYTAFSRELASHWSNSIDGKSIMYTIRLPKGAKVSRNLEHGGEVLMPRGAEYKLISKTKEGNHTEVVLEYILPTKDNVAEIEALAKKFNINLD